MTIDTGPPGAKFRTRRIGPGASPPPPTLATDPPLTPSWPPHPRSRPRSRAGTVVGSGFVLHHRLGAGGVGEVWVAEHRVDRRRAAVKLLLPSVRRDRVRLARFLREGRLALALEHPHIVKVLEVGAEPEQLPFLAMELLAGPSLHTLVSQGGPLPWARARTLLLQICAALGHAHTRTIVHHDIKPSNVVLARLPGQPDHAKLLDFGIARGTLLFESFETLTFDDQILGSPGYMSPEQIRGQRANPRSDLFGLGCTAHFLLTGSDPFLADTLPALVHSTLTCPAPPLGPIAAAESNRGAIEAVIHRALHKDPADRFASAAAMARAIEAIVPA